MVRSTIDHWLAGGPLAQRCVARVTAGVDGVLLAGDDAPLAGGVGHNAVTLWLRARNSGGAGDSSAAAAGFEQRVTQLTPLSVEQLAQLEERAGPAVAAALSEGRHGAKAIEAIQDTLTGIAEQLLQEGKLLQEVGPRTAAPAANGGPRASGGGRWWRRAWRGRNGCSATGRDGWGVQGCGATATRDTTRRGSRASMANRRREMRR